ncbi:uncharacterized protein LOC131613910 [Vicia villosa]|uniref:uncharacterized protein LOC131613910 n=1 Tax=Vicia villosa TaxID=3911 RepID=UPI00273C1666|nr:uncharacterized protein LOC131613910 [Vicia villosa]
MEAGSSFLNCDIDHLPFKYLGVKVGDSPRKVSMWKELINQIKARLATWRGKHLNMAGRVTMINTVLNAIPMFSLSFYRAPNKVINDIRKIQSNFLWHKSEGAVSSRVNNGRGTAFWHSKWLGNQAIKEVYTEAFAASTNQNCSVADLIF